jgi:hypothetical protein
LVSVLNAYTFLFYNVTHDNESLIFQNTGSNSLYGNIPTEVGNLIYLTDLYFGKYISDLYYLFVLQCYSRCCVFSLFDVLSIFPNTDFNLLGGTMPSEICALRDDPLIYLGADCDKVNCPCCNACS